jgi:hypothetical protein
MEGGLLSILKDKGHSVDKTLHLIMLVDLYAFQGAFQF